MSERHWKKELKEKHFNIISKTYPSYIYMVAATMLDCGTAVLALPELKCNPEMSGPRVRHSPSNGDKGE